MLNSSRQNLPNMPQVRISLLRSAVDHPEKAIYWKLTIEFGRMYEKVQREWCEYCIRELEGLRHSKSGQGNNGNMGADTKEGEYRESDHT